MCHCRRDCNCRTRRRGSGLRELLGGEHLALANPQTSASPMPPNIVFVRSSWRSPSWPSPRRIPARCDSAPGIIILPLRNPVVLAKQLASVDVLSNGRLIFGIGIGNLRVRINAVGMPFDHKGKRAEEMIAAMKALWTMDRAEYRGRFFSFGGVRAEPRPITAASADRLWRQDHLCLSRTARLGDGWFGYGLDLDSAANCIAGIRDACTKHGRPSTRSRSALRPRLNSTTTSFVATPISASGD